MLIILVFLKGILLWRDYVVSVVFSHIRIIMEIMERKWVGETKLRVAEGRDGKLRVEEKESEGEVTGKGDKGKERKQKRKGRGKHD